jgi:hypothetical protein
MNPLPADRDPHPEVPMDGVFHYLGVAMALGALGFGMFSFYRGLSLPPNEHRVPGKGDNWST